MGAGIRHRSELLWYPVVLQTLQRVFVWAFDWCESGDCDTRERACRYKVVSSVWVSSNIVSQWVCSTFPWLILFSSSTLNYCFRYPGTSKCLNDGNAPSWQHNMYESQSTCCSSSRFNWDYKNCMGLAHEPSQSWYMSWSAGKCVKDCDASEGGSCGGLIVGSWVVKHGNADACCNEHMSSAFSKCMGNW